MVSSVSCLLCPDASRSGLGDELSSGCRSRESTLTAGGVAFWSASPRPLIFYERAEQRKTMAASVDPGLKLSRVWQLLCAWLFPKACAGREEAPSRETLTESRLYDAKPRLLTHFEHARSPHSRSGAYREAQARDASFGHGENLRHLRSD